MKRNRNSGFSLIEALIVVAITLVLAGIAIPVFITTIDTYRFAATVSAASGALSSTRMQAIMRGCPYELIFTPSSLSYQLYSEVPPIGTVGCLTSYSLVTPQTGSATTPLPNAGPMTMTGLVSCTAPPALTGCTAMTGTTITYTFSSNGTVTSNPSGVGMQIQYKVYTHGAWVSARSNTIWVSGVGNVSTSNP